MELAVLYTWWTVSSNGQFEEVVYSCGQCDEGPCFAASDYRDLDVWMNARESWVPVVDVLEFHYKDTHFNEWCWAQLTGKLCYRDEYAVKKLTKDQYEMLMEVRREVNNGWGVPDRSSRASGEQSV